MVEIWLVARLVIPEYRRRPWFLQALGAAAPPPPYLREDFPRPQAKRVTRHSHRRSSVVMFRFCPWPASFVVFECRHLVAAGWLVLLLFPEMETR